MRLNCNPSMQIFALSLIRTSQVLEYKGVRSRKKVQARGKAEIAVLAYRNIRQQGFAAGHPLHVDGHVVLICRSSFAVSLSR